VQIGETFVVVRPDTSRFAAETTAGTAAGSAVAGGAAGQTFAQRFAASAGRVGTTLTKTLTLPLLGIGVLAGKLAVDFESSMSKIQGLVGLSANQVDRMKQSVLNLSGETTRAPVELSEALFFITSAGLRGKDALGALEFSAKAAAAGLGETKTVADVVTSAMNAYGPSVLNARTATDVLVATVKTGKAPAADFAAQFGKILPVASELGISFDQVGGAMAYLTRSTGDAALAGTQLDAIVRKLIKPTEVANKELAAVGTSMDEVRTSLRERGLLATLVDLRERFGDNTEAMGRLFEEGTAVAGVLQLTKDGGTAAAGAMRDTAEAAGSTDKAFDVASKTAKFKLEKSLNDLRLAGTKLGEDLVPIGTRIAGVLGDIAAGFAALPESAQNLVLIGAAAAATTGPLLKIGQNVALLVDQFTRADSGLNTFGRNVGGPAFAGNVAKGGLALGGFLIAAQLIGPKLTEMTGSAEVAGGALGAMAGLTFGPWGAVVGGVLGAVAGHFGLLGDAAKTSQQRAREAVERLTQALLDQDSVVNRMSIKQLTEDFKAAGDAADEAARKLLGEGLGGEPEKVYDPLIAKFREMGLTQREAAAAAQHFGTAQADAGRDSTEALLAMNITYEDLNRSLQGGPVVMDEWIASQVAAAQAGGATSAQAAALGLVLADLAPKWIEANAEAARSADVNNNAAFFLGQFDNNLASLNSNLAASQYAFAATNQITGITATQLTNAGRAAVGAGAQLRDQGVATEYVNATLGNNAQLLVDQVNQITQGNIPATAAHTAELLGIPPERFTNVHTTADIAAIVAQHFIDTVNNTPLSKTTGFHAETQQASRTIRDWIASLPNEHRIRVIADLAPRAFGRQHGGWQPPGEIGWVGEAGRELAVFGKGARIISHAESERIARDALGLTRVGITPAHATSTLKSSSQRGVPSVTKNYHITVNALHADLDERALLERLERMELLHG
jgi:TP901 family phage tail tape measure protein